MIYTILCDISGLDEKLSKSKIEDFSFLIDLVSKNKNSETRKSRIGAYLTLKAFYEELFAEKLPKITRNEYGKPFFVYDGRDETKIVDDFSISHDGDFVAVTISTSGEVGVDLQSVKEIKNKEKIIKKVYGVGIETALQSVFDENSVKNKIVTDNSSIDPNPNCLDGKNDKCTKTEGRKKTPAKFDNFSSNSTTTKLVKDLENQFEIQYIYAIMDEIGDIVYSLFCNENFEPNADSCAYRNIDIRKINLFFEDNQKGLLDNVNNTLQNGEEYHNTDNKKQNSPQKNLTFSEKIQKNHQEFKGLDDENQDFTKKRKAFDDENQDFIQKSNCCDEKTRDFSHGETFFEEEKRGFSQEGSLFEEKNHHLTQNDKLFDEENRDFSQEGAPFEEKNHHLTQNDKPFDEETRDFSQKRKVCNEKTQNFNQKSNCCDGEPGDFCQNRKVCSNEKGDLDGQLVDFHKVNIETDDKGRKIVKKSNSALKYVTLRDETKKNNGKYCLKYTENDNYTLHLVTFETEKIQHKSEITPFGFEILWTIAEAVLKSQGTGFYSKYEILNLIPAINFKTIAFCKSNKNYVLTICHKKTNS